MSTQPPRPGVGTKPLVLGLLLASPAGSLDVGSLIRGADVFDIQANALRVCLTRLLADGDVETHGRGLYRIGGEALRLARQAASWTDRLNQWVDVDGDRLHADGAGYVAVSGVDGNKTRDKVARAQQQALALLGFKPWQGLYWRPNNLMLAPVSGDKPEVQHRVTETARQLRTLGLPEECPVFRVDGLSTQDGAAIRALWTEADLNRRYTETTARLSDWLERAEDLPLKEAARQAWELGADAIRSVVYDPLLPRPWIDAHARHAMVNAVRRMDQAGKAIWARYLASAASVSE